jgi:hypothetical protein
MCVTQKTQAQTEECSTNVLWFILLPFQNVTFYIAEW